MAEVAIQTLIRVRPLVKDTPSQSIITVIDPQNVQVQDPGADDAGQSAATVQNADFVFGDTATQRDIYQSVGQSLLDKAFDGVNVMVFAYGQVASGKSHTLFGSSDRPGVLKDPGLLPLFSEDLFKRIPPGSPCLVSVSYCEIVNYRIRDLLFPLRDQDLPVYEHPTLGFVVQGLKWLVCRSSEQLLEYFKQGEFYRRAGGPASKCAENNAIFTIKFEQKAGEGTANTATYVSTIKFILLAGTIVPQQVLALKSFSKELIKIIKAKAFIPALPEKEGKILKLMRDGLYGNAYTLLVATISPADASTSNGSTLKYVNHFRRIKNLCAPVVDGTAQLVQDLHAQITALEAEFKTTHDSNTALRLEAAKTDLKIASDESWEAKQTHSAAAETERKDHFEREGLGEAFLLARPENPELTMRRDQLRDEKERLVGEHNKLSKIVKAKKTELESKKQENPDDPATRELEAEYIALREKLAALAEQAKKVNAEYRSEVQRVELMQKAELDTAASRRFMDQQRQQDEDSKLQALKADMLRSFNIKLEEEKARLKRELAAGGMDTSMLESKLEAAEHDRIKAEHEKDFIMKELKMTKDQLEYYKNTVEQRSITHEAELERLQLQHMLVFRKYREYFEEQQRKIESRYAAILQNCVNDITRLSGENLSLRGKLGIGPLEDLGIIPSASVVGTVGRPPPAPAPNSSKR